LDSFLTFFYPLSFSPKGERFCSFPLGGRLGWGSLSYQKKLYELTVTFIVKNYTAGGEGRVGGKKIKNINMKGKLLENKKGIIFGALNEKSIAWQIAIKAWQHGAQLVLTNSPVAVRMGNINELAEMTGSKVITADATKMEDIDNLLTESIKIFGGQFDFILHSIGMSPNVRKDIPYEQTSYENLTFLPSAFTGFYRQHISLMQ
jgi:hypothetical protein